MINMAGSQIFHWWSVRRIYYYWRYWHVISALLRMTEHTRRGVGYSCRWFDADKPLEGILCWIEWVVTATPRPSHPAYDQFELRVFPVTTAEWQGGRWQSLPWGEAPLFGADGVTWQGNRAKWTQHGRSTVSKEIMEKHVGLYVVVWAMGPVMRAAATNKR